VNPWHASEGPGPRTHALIIGVSRYPHLPGGGEAVGPEPMGMKQLTAAARSAHAFAEWLVQNQGNLGQPLGDVWLLLSPSPNEVNEVATDVPAPTHDTVRAALLAWRAACDASPDNVGVVFVAGHGIQDAQDAGKILLADFNAPGFDTFHGTLDVARCRRAMNRANTANTQFWFVDACRVRPSEVDRFEEIQGSVALAIPNGPTATTSVVFSSTAHDTLAYAIPNDHTLFWTALRDCLGGRAAREIMGERGWFVTVHGLAHALVEAVDQLARQYGARQLPEPGGIVRDATLLRMSAPPVVEVRIELDPIDASSRVVGTLFDHAHQPVLQDVRFSPRRPCFECHVPAGVYALHVTPRPPAIAAPVVRMFKVEPPVATPDPVPVP